MMNPSSQNKAASGKRKRPIRLQLVERPLPGHRHRSERLLSGRFEIELQPRLPFSEKPLIEALDRSPAQRVWVVMTPTALPALAARRLWPQSHVAYFHIDAHQTLEADHLAVRYGMEPFETRCAENLPASEPAPDLVLSFFGRRQPSGLSCEIIRQARSRLAPSGHMLALTDDPNDQWLRRQLQKSFGNLTLLRSGKWSRLYDVKRKGPPPQPSEAEHFVMQTPVVWGGESLRFETCHGVSCPDALPDRVRVLLEGMTPPQPCRSILVLGAGWGALGILAARATGAQHLKMIEPNARAAAMARRNVERLGPPDAEVCVAADPFLCLPEHQWRSWDMVLGQPGEVKPAPITDRFLATGRAALRPGGQICLVCSDADMLLKHVARFFETCRHDRQWGYSIACAEQPGA